MSTLESPASAITALSKNIQTKYIVYVRDEEFTLRRSQLEFDAYVPGDLLTCWFYTNTILFSDVARIILPPFSLETLQSQAVRQCTLTEILNYSPLSSNT